MGDFAAAEVADCFLGGVGVGLEADPGHDLLAESLVGDADDLHVVDVRMGVEELLDLAGIDVLAAANDHVLEATGDLVVALVIDGGEVAGVEPAVGVDGVGGGVGHVVVAQHHHAAAGLEFALFAGAHFEVGVGVDQADLHVGQHLAHGGDAALDAVVGQGLGDDRRGLGEAVGDGDALGAHAVDDLAHDLDGAGGAGHDAGAQGAEVELGEVGMAELGDEHGGHAVDGGAAFVGYGGESLERVEVLGGNDHGGAVDDAVERAHDAAEAVVEGHGDAEAVVLVHLHAVADVEGVGQDVVVGEGRALGVAGGARGVLDVDGVVGAALGLAGLEVCCAHLLGVGEQVAPAPHALGRWRVRRVVGRNEYEVAEVREVGGVQLAGRRFEQLGDELVDHAHVVGGAEAADENQGGELGLLQQVGQLVGAVGGVDVDQDGADLGGGELGQHPLGVVGGPDADVLAFLDADGHQAAGDALHLGVELAVGEPVAGGGVDECFAVGIAVGLLVKDVADGEAGVDGWGHGNTS